MNLLFLRGQVPQDRDPKQIMFDNIQDCDDMWTHLAYTLSGGDQSEIWYWGGNRIVQYSNFFTERWIPSFEEYKPTFVPDVIFARGGFKQYDCVFDKFPDSFKIYYGAGKRIYPYKMFDSYNLILTDSKEQSELIKRKSPKSIVSLFIKPACDNIFKPILGNKKIYDIILVGNYNQKVDKGHDFIFKNLKKDYKILSVGLVPQEIREKYKHVTYKGWVSRSELPYYYSISKVSVIACGTVDSCPRVIPESIACGCPVLVASNVNFWKEKYITPCTGLVSTRKDFASAAKVMVNNYLGFNCYEYYLRNLDLASACDFLMKRIGKGQYESS